MAMLLKEGFRFEGYVDVFDAGPQVHCNRDQVATVRRSREGRIEIASDRDVLAETFLVANRSLSRFRVVAAAGREEAEGGLSVGPAALAALGAEPGEIVRFATFRGD
jgi:arginine N-succinyltransferase